jgi:nucleoid-associated protein YgaU
MNMMSKNVRVSVIIFMALFVLVSLAGCAKPPTKEMSDAKEAFQQATDAGAPEYAADQYMSAEEALNAANQFMEQKKYKQAREKAIEVMKLAREAQANAVNQKNAMNRDARETYELALQAVNSANQAGAYTYAPQQMEDAQRTLEEARRTYEAGDYKSAKQLAEAALAKAQDAEKVATQVRATQEAQTAQQIAQEIRDPGATPRPYPTNHVVIKGETLWWIAEYKQIYDDPFQWPLIYKANRSKIKDPDLIFPDQNFVIPRSPELTDEMVKEAIKFAKTRGAWSLHDGK